MMPFAPPPSPALAGSSSSAARGRVFTHPPHPGRPSWRSDSSSLSTGFHRTLAWRASHPHSSPLAQDSSWSRTALRAAARPHSIPSLSSPSPSRSSSPSKDDELSISSSGPTISLFRISWYHIRHTDHLVLSRLPP
ncbi:hypothetical protein EV363DRAFT_1263352 [Boletus edulis]|nr:hypothetical protein EV363DRAFT_1263352 [Boletus edulis]